MSRSNPSLVDALHEGFYSIGEAARLSGVSARMIRHYESIDLLPESQRTAANYRLYGRSDIHQLQFIKRARNLGFSVKQIVRLVGLWQNRERCSADVKALALNHVQELDQRIKEMREMRNALSKLAQQCHGDYEPQCPILESLAKEGLYDSANL